MKSEHRRDRACAIAKALIAVVWVFFLIQNSPVAADDTAQWRQVNYSGKNRVTLWNDAAGPTDYPLIGIDETYDRPKILMRSTIWGDPGDTVDLGVIIANGTAASPTYRTAPYPGFYHYGWPLDTSGAVMASQSPYGGAEYLGRNAQISMWLMETPTQTARGGALVFGTTPLGKRTPFDRMWIRPNGWTVFTGRAFEDSGIGYPYNPAGLAIQQHFSPMAGINPYDYAGVGTITALAPDQADGAALALQSDTDIDTGVRFVFNKALGRVSYVAENDGVQRSIWTTDFAYSSTRLERAFYLEGGTTPAMLTADVADYSLAGTVTVLRMSSNATRSIRGLTGGGDGRIVYILNVGSNNIVLQAQDGASQAQNRFGFPANITLAPNQGQQIYWSGVTNRWHAM
jgi:hypothetical protein